MPTILKPSWVSHDGHPIYSIDIHPEATKFATGSLDSKIKIWSFIPLKDPSKDVKSESRLISTLVSHAGAVNSVRWSKSGTYLASGSDDQTVIIWEKKSGPGSKVFGSDEVNIENWWPKLILQGHTGDVIDVCWSMDSTMVASCSVDNKIFIWSVNSKDPIRVLSHEGLIKGLSWDPTGRYIASQSDDGKTIIWRISDGAKESEIHKPFRNSKLSFFMRPSWSPDGQYLVTANGMKKHKHIAPIIHRANWQSNLEYVGHKGAVIAAKFNPIIFVTHDTPFYICALASQDTLISIWSSNRFRPILVIENLFSKAPVDLSWSSDGLSLLSCSQDGNISVIIFKQEELGERMNQRDLELHWKKLYGDSSSITMISANIVEDPYLLKIKKETEKEESNNIVQNEVSITLNSTDQPNSLSQKTVTQIETKLANGKRRIQPVHISSLNETPTITVFSTRSTINETSKSTEQDQSKNEKSSIDQVKELLPVKKHKVSENYADHFLYFHPHKLDHVIKNNILSPPEPSFKIEQQILDKVINVYIAGLEEEGKNVISTITCQYKSLILWKTEIFGAVTVISGSSNLFAVGCYSGDVYTFTPSGRRASPCLKSAASPVYLLEIFDALILVLHCDGALRLWNIEKKHLIVETNISPLVKKSEFEVISVGTTSLNNIYIIMENGKAFIYDKSMDCWFQVYDPIYNLSEFPPFNFMDEKEGILYEVNKHSSMTNENNIQKMAFISNQRVSENTITFLEDQIALAHLLNKSDDNKKWMRLYAQKLKDHPSKVTRLEELNWDL